MSKVDEEPISPERRLKVFFDGSCPLCSREIKFYRRLAGSNKCYWIDANTMSAGEIPSKLTREDLLKRFHVEHSTEGFLSGALAFAMLWSEMFGRSWIYKFVKWPIVTFVAELAYRGFLPLRKLLKSKPVPR